MDKSQCKIVFFINALHVLRSINTLLFECSAAIINKRYPKHKAAQRLTIKVDRTDLMYLKKSERALFIYFFDLLKIKESNVNFDRFYFYNATYYLVFFFQCVIGFVAICNDTDIQNTYCYKKRTSLYLYLHIKNYLTLINVTSKNKCKG